jgi:hypothetical protein
VHPHGASSRLLVLKASAKSYTYEADAILAAWRLLCCECNGVVRSARHGRSLIFALLVYMMFKPFFSPRAGREPQGRPECVSAPLAVYFFRLRVRLAAGVCSAGRARCRKRCSTAEGSHSLLLQRVCLGWCRGGPCGPEHIAGAR